MNLESLKNMDVNDLLAKLKGQSDIFKDKKIMIKIGVGFGAILIFLIIYYGFVSPVVKKQQIKIAEMEDFQNKTKQEFETQRFRGNILVDGVDAWEERNWIGKTIKINDISFKVEKNIPRCVAINLKPNTDDDSLNLLQSLKKTYNHFDMGVYLTALDSGEINIGDIISK